jgi:DNA-directed RNA polymerase specialized sigma24 family protein
MEERTEEQQALARLLARIALRDRSAFERLYQQVNGKLNSVALAIVGQQALADDVLQDAFMQIWHNAGSYHEELGTPLVWMRAIVRYRAFDQLSQQKRKRQLTGDDPADHPVEGVNAMSIANCHSRQADPGHLPANPDGIQSRIHFVGLSLRLFARRDCRTHAQAVEHN